MGGMLELKIQLKNHPKWAQRGNNIFKTEYYQCHMSQSQAVSREEQKESGDGMGQEKTWRRNTGRNSAVLDQKEQ